MMSNTALNLPISFPGKILVPYWQRNRLSKLLCNRHYACILMVTSVDFSEMELIVLRTFLENDLYHVSGVIVSVTILIVSNRSNAP